MFWCGVFFFIMGVVLYVTVDTGFEFGATFSEGFLSIVRDSPPFLIGFGIFLVIISLVSMARSK